MYNFALQRFIDRTDTWDLIDMKTTLMVNMVIYIRTPRTKVVQVLICCAGSMIFQTALLCGTVEIWGGVEQQAHLLHCYGTCALHFPRPPNHYEVKTCECANTALTCQELSQTYFV